MVSFSMLSLQNISAKEFLDMVARNAGNMEIIDVRGIWEYDFAKFPGAKYIPLPHIVADRQNASDSIDWTKDVVFVCRSGGRSEQAALLLGNFSKRDKAYNLEGGLKRVFEENPDVLEGERVKMEQYFF